MMGRSHPFQHAVAGHGRRDTLLWPLVAFAWLLTLITAWQLGYRAGWNGFADALLRELSKLERVGTVRL